MNAFDRFAEAASRFVSRAWFFLACVVLVLIWLPSLPLFGCRRVSRISAATRGVAPDPSP